MGNKTKFLTKERVMIVALTLILIFSNAAAFATANTHGSTVSEAEGKALAYSELGTKNALTPYEEVSGLSTQPKLVTASADLGLRSITVTEATLLVVYPQEPTKSE